MPKAKNTVFMVSDTPLMLVPTTSDDAVVRAFLRMDIFSLLLAIVLLVVVSTVFSPFCTADVH